MIEFLEELTRQFREVTPESYHAKNRKKVVTYPYATFDFDSESLDRNVDGFYIDVDIFDSNASFIRLFVLEDQLKDHFKDRTRMTEDVYIRFNFLRSNKIETGDNLLKRRNIQFYCKTDWRKK